MNLYSNNLPVLEIISPSIIMELFPACFSCINNIHISSLRFSGKTFVEIPEATIAGDLSNLIRKLSLRLVLPKALSPNRFLLQNHAIIFYPLN